MKFKTLHIQNLASIENAVIEFDRQPLAGSEVFLITGKTGSGKTTILDAISLALFGRTARMENTKMEGKSPDVKQDVDVNNVSQLMRRNTGETEVRLKFEGNNFMEYEAVWHIQRANKRADGKIQDSEHSLTRISDNTFFGNKKDVKEEINAAIGLDFKQFCRTTMLAQGQFTQFLNSADKDKASILEKITGVDVYTRIGKKVYEVTKHKEQEWNHTVAQIGGIKVLKPEETESKEIELRDLTERSAQLTELCAAQSAKLQWIKKLEELEGKSEKSQREFTQKQEQWESKEVQEKKLLSESWNETAEVRGWLTETARLADVERNARKRLGDLEKTFSNCMAAKIGIEKCLEADRQALADINQRMEAGKAKDSAIKNSQSIIMLIDSIARDKDTIAGQKSIIDELNQKLGDYEDTLTVKQTDVKSKADAVTDRESYLNEAETKVKDIALSRLREERTAFDSFLHQIELARVKLDSLADTQKSVDKKKTEIFELAEIISAVNKDIDLLLPQVEKSATLVKERKRALDSLSNSVNEWSKRMRAELKPGSVCPVCRQEVTTLQEEKLIDGLFLQADKDLKEAETEFKKCSDELGKLINDKNVSSQLLDQKRKELDADTSLKKAQEAVKTQFQALGLETRQDKGQAELDRLQMEMEKKSEDVRQKITYGEELEKRRDYARGDLDGARKALDKAKEEFAKLQDVIKSEQSKLDSSKNLIGQKHREIDGSEQKLRSLLENSGTWDYDWQEDGKAFKDKLSALVRERGEAVDKSAKLTDSINRTADMLKRVEETTHSIYQVCPAWKGRPAGQKSSGHLESAVNQLYIDTHTCSAQLEEAVEKRHELEIGINEYISHNPSYTVECLSALNLRSQAEIKALSKELHDLKEACELSRGLAEYDARLKKEHENSKPELAEEETVETLELQIQIFGHDHTELLKRIGALNQELEANQQLFRQIESLRRKSERARCEYERWDKLNKLIGSATGDTFRKIAQSYVLAALVHAANHYMKTLAPRYSLYAQPGSFLIFIEDAYQGYARRPASTISGGESFLVSLALALALSDIGQRLSVDTLFIDEGFGTLSGEPLMNAINTLRMLHSRMGRHVGIISHVEELQECIPVQIRVEQEGASSSSRISVV